MSTLPTRCQRSRPKWVPYPKSPLHSRPTRQSSGRLGTQWIGFPGRDSFFDSSPCLAPFLKPRRRSPPPASTMASLLNNLFGGKSTDSPNAAKAGGDPGKQVLFGAFPDAAMQRCINALSASASARWPARHLPPSWSCHEKLALPAPFHHAASLPTSAADEC